MTLTPRPYQEVGRDFLASRRHALLADEMRVGKTPQAILAAHKVGAKSILVTCPAIAVTQWESEIARWWPVTDKLPNFKVWSYDRARMNWAAGMKGKVDVFIADEAHFAKNPEALRTKMVYGKTGFGQHAGALWALSGTPATKHAAELWPMLRAFGVVKMTYFDFVQHYCTTDMDRKPTGTKMKMIPELRKLLSRVMLRRMRKDVDVDAKDISFEFLNINPVSKPDVQLPDGSSRMTDSQLVDWLEQHPTYDRENRIEVALAKATHMVGQLAFELNNQLLKQTVVFGWHKEPLKYLHAALCERGIDAALITGDTSQSQRDVIKCRFREGKIQVVVANIMAAGTAIDLSAANHGYFLELDWVPGNNMQAANRLMAMYKEAMVTMDIVTWPGSADDRVQRVLLRRAKELGKLL